MALGDSSNVMQELGWKCVGGPLDNKYILSSDYIPTTGFSFKLGTGEEVSVYTLSSDGLFIYLEDVKVG